MLCAKYAVGDTVRIVDSPTECAFNWVDEMDKYCGKETTVESVTWEEAKKAFRYRLEGFSYNWCENCFVEDVDFVIEEEEFDALIGFQKE